MADRIQVAFQAVPDGPVSIATGDVVARHFLNVPHFRTVAARRDWVLVVANAHLTSAHDGVQTKMFRRWVAVPFSRVLWVEAAS